MKRFLMELIGTFFITLAVIFLATPIAIGLMAMAMIYVGGHVSGGHFNPAISCAAFDIRGVTSGKIHNYFIYFTAQIIGAYMAVLFVGKVRNDIIPLSEFVPYFSTFLAMCIEALMVTVLCWVYLTMNMSARYRTTSLNGIAIGLTLMAITCFPGIFNPAIAAGLLIFESHTGGMTGWLNELLIIYFLGPILGGIAASFLFAFFNTETN